MFDVSSSIPTVAFDAMAALLRHAPRLPFQGRVFHLEQLYVGSESRVTYRIRVYEEKQSASIPAWHGPKVSDEHSHYLRLNVMASDFEPSMPAEQVLDEVTEVIRIRPTMPAATYMVSWVFDPTDEEAPRVCLIDAQPDERSWSLSELFREKIDSTVQVGDLTPYLTGDGRFTAKEAMVLMHMAKVHLNQRALGVKRS